MSAIEGIFVLDSENSVVGDKSNLESVARKKLGDISNLPQAAKHLTQDEKPQFISTITKEYIDQLQKENMALMKLLADRIKIVELSGIELQKLAFNLQKVQQQNLHLAQANSQMLVQLNSGKDRRKVLQHELGYKNGLIKAKKVELEEKAKRSTCQKIISEVGMTQCKDSSQANGDINKPCNINRKQKSKSLGPSIKQVEVKAKAENKRLCSRRQSARFKSEEAEPTGDLFLVDDAKFPACDQKLEDSSSSMCSLVEKDDKEGNTAPRDEAQVSRRSSVGRPSRLAAMKVQSYKEIPLHVKMRRPE
ncbi:hypothetical protein F0562_025937 [Nyssa sinensis]|uniref:Shugoshin C-terminal domain-containing protein n=1 Tax=Nyssa sinensis TaxID=561372 RepID=A0A5J5B7N2_9ASTE|nr:hypothetical protein F0562_025937 [Nyssa sinensis]